MTNQRVAVLGLGKIGTILLQGLLKAGVSPGSACATVRHVERARALSAHLPVTVGTDNRAAARAGDVILIAVKPQNVGDLLDEIDRKSTRLNSSHTVISYAVFCLKKKKTYKLQQQCHRLQSAVRAICGLGGYMQSA